jgi:maltooligosyltrehalose trehalohydrolase
VTRSSRRFEVWAPHPDRVALSVEGREVPADRSEGGWWVAEADDAPPDARYRWILDGAAPVPDPRSRRQPDGVLGASQLVPEGFATWTDEGFRPPPPTSLALYELHVGTFTAAGTFDAAIERIDHLVDLGVNAVEVMPIASFPGVRGWGYDGVSLSAAHEPYGGPAGFARFVDACHRAGLAVVLDVVLNHLGPLGNHLARFGPYFTDAVSTPWGDALNLDGPGSDEVRAFLLDVCRWWLVDLHVDGLRLDAVHALHDTSPRHLLGELAAEAGTWAAATERRLGLIAESDRNDPAYVTPLEAGGIGLDAMWADDCHHVLHVALTGERDGYYEDYTGVPSELADVLAHGYLYRGQRSRHRQRPVGRPLPPDVGLDRVVWSAQNHDQVGNRARGERLGHLTGTGRLYAPAAVVLLGPAVPMVFQGEEWAASTPFGYVTDHPDPDLAEAVRSGRRAEFAAFGWDPEDVLDPQDPATHDRSVLRWDELDRAPHAEILTWYRTLLGLRRARPELRDGRQGAIAVEADDDAGWVRFRRHGAGPAHPATEVVVNLGAEPAPVPVDARLVPLALSPGTEHRGPRVVVPAGGAAVLEVPGGRGG